MKSIGPIGLLHPDYLKSLETMPRTAAGHVVDLHYVPPGQVAAYEAEWRKWCAAHDRKLWPAWLFTWAETKKRRERNAI